MSPSLADIFMIRFEVNTINYFNDFLKPWVSYEVDVFAIIYNDFEQENFLKKIKFQYSSIKFTHEKECGGKLPFL